jgi:phosphopantothenoylcysteine decarboxylase/phosphopantothenate--cysteine ligase
MNPKTSSVFRNKKIMLCVTGSIAAYKAANICSSLVKMGSDVFPVLSPNSLNFINPVTFSTISGNRAIFEQYSNEEKVYHISLSHSVDAVLIAPATANTIAKLSSGICDNFLTTAVISSTCPVMIAPAMNESMYFNHAIQKSIEILKQSGKYFFIEPSYGKLACGEEGVGRLAEDEEILKSLESILAYSDDLKGKHVLITAGGTAEFIDSVRFISNLSSGKMGYGLAEEAFFRGAEEVVLITTKKDFKKPYGVTIRHVTSTAEMQEEIIKHYNSCDITIMAAAVSDVVPAVKYDYKLKKNDDIISKLKFKENINILRYLADNKKKNQYLVGFSAESGVNVENSIKKIENSGIDMIVLNDISRKDIGFESDFNEVFIITLKGETEKIKKNTKRLVSRKIWDSIIEKMA